MTRLPILLFLLVASCQTVEVGYADIQNGNDNPITPSRSDEMRPRTKVVVDRYLVEVAESDNALATALAAFEDGSVRVEGREIFTRHGLKLFACRPGTMDDVKKLLDQAKARSESSMCQSYEKITFEFLAADRDVTVVEAANGAASARDLTVTKSLLAVEPILSKGGAIQVQLTPQLNVAEPEMAAWGLPDLKGDLVVDAARMVVLYADASVSGGQQAAGGGFGPAWLHTGREGSRKRAILVLGFHLRA